ncbi:MAG: nucleotide pyrophosphohydrolase [Candidatus Odinarchaeota archaeon]|nr:nucleotide pyrophosphohydrolase [Candidatus Odinarchaeota archaeon]
MQKVVDVLINEFKDKYWPPLSMVAALVEEVGELAREINMKELGKSKGMGKIKEELGDVLFATICIANYYGISISESLLSTIEKYRRRDLNIL